MKKKFVKVTHVFFPKDRNGDAQDLGKFSSTLELNPLLIKNWLNSEPKSDKTRHTGKKVGWPLESFAAGVRQATAGRSVDSTPAKSGAHAHYG